jgi:hypothetical protein
MGPVNSRFFPFKREIHRFCPKKRRSVAKTASQIIVLRANSRSRPYREFPLAQPGIKFAEPGITGIIADNPSPHGGKAPQKNQKQPHPSAPSKSDKTST